GQYKESLESFDQFLAIEKVNKVKINEALRLRANADYALKNQNEWSARPRPLSDTVNRFLMQYFPVLTADEQQLFFTRRNGPTDRDTEDIVVSTKDSLGRFGIPVSVSPVINSPENEGTCTVSADGRLIIFTSCRGRAGFGNCDLFESRRIGNRWTEPRNLGAAINSTAWESQPSLSADGRELFFVSDRKGGVGARDIYRSVRDDNGKWTPAKNTGSVINTRYDEISPFLHASGRILFFASNGRVGFGGYDIFYSHWQDSVWSAPVNFGSPVNNHEDQFSLFITADGKKAYYSHEEARDQNTGKIFSLEVPPSLQIREVSAAVKGRVVNAETEKPVKARIELINLKTNASLSYVYSDSLNGNYLMVLTRGSDYGLFVTAPGYLYKSQHFNLTNEDPEQLVIDLRLSPVHAGSSMVLQNIFFDYDSYALKQESLPELEKATRFLRENPSIRIEISGHTDNTGTETKNQSLSVNRAKSVADQLIRSGIDGSRIKASGYGSSRPVVPNDTEAGRQRNRRIEFKVLNVQ
ncbi:MAG: OmpA family protein, partial [Cyclobacteriaceae bacterium]